MCNTTFEEDMISFDETMLKQEAVKMKQEAQGYVLQLTQDSKFTMMDPSGMDEKARAF